MLEATKIHSKWSNLKIGITGARGELGKALIKEFKLKGAYIIGITHSKNSALDNNEFSANEYIHWECGREDRLDQTLNSLDILILNHGVNLKGKINSDKLNKTLEVNSLSTWKIFERFEALINKINTSNTRREVWVNTSEAEVQPAFSPVYEISKRLLGQLVSLKSYSRKDPSANKLVIRKLILGPFRSNLNPIGIMSSSFVAKNIIFQANLNINLIIVTPNPLTYFIFPLNELIRFIYFKFLSKWN